MRPRLWALVPATAFLFSFSPPSVFTEPALAPSATTLPLQTIVQRIEQHNASQADELGSYDATRHYAIQYKGFGTDISAAMAVKVHYDRSSGKTFSIISQTGSKLLADKVLKKAVESEQEAARDKNSTALSTANYKFQLVGSDVLNGRPAYVLHVDPLRPGKFLYRGKVWVDAADYAVAKIEVEPAKNPSFWITRSEIENTYAQTDGVWLPQSNRSESKIRIGGTAVLTIDYGAYRIALQPQHARMAAPAPSAR